MDFMQTPQFGEILEQGKQTAANSVKTALSDAVNSVSGQIGIKNEQNASSQNSNQQQGQTPQTEPSVIDMNLANEQTTEQVKDYYAPSSDQKPMPTTQEEAQTQQELLKLRKELHDQIYYQPLFAYEHKKEERPAEAKEKEEEQKKMAELEQQKKENKNLPIAVLRAQTSAEVKLAGAG